MLKELGSSVITACDGREAVEILRIKQLCKGKNVSNN